MALFSSLLSGISAITSIGGLALNILGFTENQSQVSKNNQTVAQNNAERLRQAREEKEANLKINKFNIQIASAQNKAALAAQEAERIRLRQTALERTRAKRAAIREALVAQAETVNIAANQGALRSSSARSARGEAVARTARNIRDIEQNFSIGQDIFSQNQIITEQQQLINTAQSEASNVRSSITPANIQDLVPGSSGAGFIELGSTLLQNSSTIASIGTSLFGRNG